MNTSSVTLLLASLLALGGSTQLSPIFIQPATLESKQGLLFETENWKVVRNELSTASDFKNIYAARIPFNMSFQDLQKYGQVLAFKRGELAVIAAKNTDLAEQLSAETHALGMACGAVVHLSGDEILPQEAVVAPMISLDEKNAQVAQQTTTLSSERIKETIAFLAARNNRYHRSETGLTVAKDLIARYKANLPEGRQDIQFSEYRHGNTPQPSLVVRIPGTTKPDEIVIIGSHIDSINGWGSNTARAPGADDNASGTAVNLEAFQILSKIKPERTIEIHGYAAEEAGLLGSQEIAAAYKRDGKNVVAMLQNDMNLYTESADKIFVVTNSTNAQLNEYLIKTIDLYGGVPWEKANLSAGTSDHASWTRQGFPAVFPFENTTRYNRNIHTVSDTIEKSGAFSQSLAFAKVTAAFVMHFAGVSEWN